MVRVWLDCDPGHDDAFALVLALFSPAVSLFGISTTAGNQTLTKTTLNARRMLAALGRSDVPVVKGVSRPLLAPPKECPEIHGVTGLDFPAECSSLAAAFEALATAEKEERGEKNGLLEAREAMMRESEFDLVATGCLTDVALLLTVFPELKARIRQVVFLGGAVRSPPGNVGVVAEFNVLLDPHAAQMVFHSGVRVVQIPLMVSHTVLFSSHVLDRMPASGSSFLADVLRGFVAFFTRSYRTVFGMEAPPLHDPLAVCFAFAPELFRLRFLNVEVETASQLCFGQTVADYEGVSGRAANVHVAESVDVEGFWALMLAACHAACSK